MEDVVACPICASGELEAIRASAYSRDPPASTGDPGLDWGYSAQRELFFTHWLAGRSEVVLTELLCARCGFVCYSPRPSTADIDRKYEALVAMGIELGNRGPYTRVDAQRARELRRRLEGHVDLRGAAVLDVGGGDGRRLRALARAGARCAVVDYATHQIPEVRRLGDTLDDLPGGARFDVAILSHVAEHVADPVGLLRAAGVVADLLYVEVPVEVWRGTPAARDPVTHVNHFTERSLRTALQIAGFVILRSRTAFSHYSHAPLEIAWAVAATATGERRVDHDPSEARRRLSPTLALRLRRRARASGVRARARLRGL